MRWKWRPASVRQMCLRRCIFYEVRLSIMLNLCNLFCNFFFQYVSCPCFFCATVLPKSIPTIRNQEVLSRVMVVAAECISLDHRRNSGSLPWFLLSRGMLHHIAGSNNVVQLFHSLWETDRWKESSSVNSVMSSIPGEFYGSPDIVGNSELIFASLVPTRWASVTCHVRSCSFLAAFWHVVHE